jgi:hypothetical protein
LVNIIQVTRRILKRFNDMKLFTKTSILLVTSKYCGHFRCTKAMICKPAHHRKRAFLWPKTWFLIRNPALFGHWLDSERIYPAPMAFAKLLRQPM